jgi:hypothetical protein
MHVQVQRDQEAYGYRDNGEWKTGSNDINYFALLVEFLKKRRGKRKEQFFEGP